MQEIDASLGSGFGRHVCLLTFKLAALIILMASPAQAALQHGNCSPLLPGYNGHADYGVLSLTPLRAGSFQHTGVSPTGFDDGDPDGPAIALWAPASSTASKIEWTPFFSPADVQEWAEGLARKRAPPHKA